MKRLKITNGESIILESNSKGIEVSHIDTAESIINKVNISNKEIAELLENYIMKDNKKYELTDETIKFEGRILYRIRALKNFSDVKRGQLGGFVESEDNLSQLDNCWIYAEGKVMDDAVIYENATVKCKAIVMDNGKMWGNSEITGWSEIRDRAMLCDEAKVDDYAIIKDFAKVRGKSRIYDNVVVKDRAIAEGGVIMLNNSVLAGNKRLRGCMYSKVDDFVEILSPEGKLVTCVLKNNKLLFNVGCRREITEEEFLYSIYNNKGGLENNPHRRSYFKIIEMANLWSTGRIG